MTRSKSRTYVAGYVEKMMRVHQLDDHETSPLGTCTSFMKTGHWVVGDEGRPHGAAAAVIMDNALTAALRNNVPNLQWMVTTELQLTALRPFPTDGTDLFAWCRPLVSTGAGGASTGVLRDVTGVDYIHAIGNFYGVPGSDAVGLQQYDDTAELALQTDEEANLHELLAANAPGVMKHPSSLVVTDNFIPGLGFNKKERLHNSHGAIHGGALMIMAALAGETALPDRQRYDLQSIRVAYLRPASGRVASRTRIRHSGRFMRIIDVDLYSAETNRVEKPFLQSSISFRTSL